MIHELNFIAQLQSDRRKKRYLDVVARIQDAMTTVPVAPKITLSAIVSPGNETRIVEEAVAGQVEVPFVPAKQRQEHTHATLEPVGDSIVVVGHAQRKKRKRTKGESASTKVAQDEDEEFDYSTVSNILDEGSDHEPEKTASTRKRKQKPQGARLISTRSVLQH